MLGTWCVSGAFLKRTRTQPVETGPHGRWARDLHLPLNRHGLLDPQSLAIAETLLGIHPLILQCMIPSKCCGPQYTRGLVSATWHRFANVCYQQLPLWLCGASFFLFKYIARCTYLYNRGSAEKHFGWSPPAQLGEEPWQWGKESHSWKKLTFWHTIRYLAPIMNCLGWISRALLNCLIRDSHVQNVYISGQMH